jgi:hypothetical protein
MRLRPHNGTGRGSKGMGGAQEKKDAQRAGKCRLREPSARAVEATLVGESPEKTCMFTHPLVPTKGRGTRDRGRWRPNPARHRRPHLAGSSLPSSKTWIAGRPGASIHRPRGPVPLRSIHRRPPQAGLRRPAPAWRRDSQGGDREGEHLHRCARSRAGSPRSSAPSRGRNSRRSPRQGRRPSKAHRIDR